MILLLRDLATNTHDKPAATLARGNIIDLNKHNGRFVVCEVLLYLYMVIERPCIEFLHINFISSRLILFS